MANRLWLIIAAGALAAAFLGCQSDVTEPNPANLPKMDEEVLVVEGNVRDAVSGNLIDDREVYVVWHCTSHYEEPNHFIGDCPTFDGYYEIWTGQDMSEHNGHHLQGKAVAAGYTDAYAEITNFQATNMPYWRDFYMYSE